MKEKEDLKKEREIFNGISVNDEEEEEEVGVSFRIPNF